MFVLLTFPKGGPSYVDTFLEKWNLPTSLVTPVSWLLLILGAVFGFLLVWTFYWVATNLFVVVDKNEK
jgi:hypothetical protein